MITLLIANSLVFSGGSTRDLAKAIAAANKTPVVVMRGDRSEIPQFKIEPSDDHLYRHLLKLFTGLETGRDFVGYGPAAWPEYFVTNKIRPGQSGFIKPKDQSPPVVVVSKQSLTFKFGPSGNFELGSLLVSPVGNDIQIHWLFERAIVAISTTEIGLEDLFKDIAEATGTRFDTQNGKLVLDLDGSVYKRRMIARIDAQIASARKRAADPYLLSDLNFQRAAFAAATGKEIEEAYAKPSSRTYIKIKPHTAIWSSLIARLAAYAKRGDSASLNKQVLKSHSELANMVDLDNDVYAVISASNVVSMFGYIKGKPSSGIEF
ncbi:MAG: hypothetical protein BGO01_18465 [Armatimonadetes bacterium 55-13]|nr:MAG: hypothetical protein BGO01_18465 [Armatimonadetes bacterium 55-13]